MGPCPPYSDHRKIELQAPADLTYLLTNIRQAAREKLDLAMPPSAAPEGKEDAFRMRVEELVHEVCLSTLIRQTSTVVEQVIITYTDRILAP